MSLGTRRRVAAHRDFILDSTLDGDGSDASRGLQKSQSRRVDDGQDAIKLLIQLLLLFTVILLTHLSLEHGPLSRLFDFRTLEGLDGFNETRALTDIDALSRLTSRITGTQTLIEAQDYVADSLERLRRDAESNGWSLDVVKQTMGPNERGSQAMRLSAGGLLFMQTYSGLVNIIAVLKPEGVKESPAVLLNCHLDTALSSGGGAGDDASGCSILLEIARGLSTTNATGLKNPVVLLFNGNEEGGLNGAHLFLTHPTSIWGRRSKAVLNLESAGSRGPAAVFQLRSPGVLQAYGKGARGKHLNVVFGDVFRTGLLVSDTDFRHWAGEGVVSYQPGYEVPASPWSGEDRKLFPLSPRQTLTNKHYTGDPDLVGLDWATYTDSYRYHTPLDEPQAIPGGVIGRWGADVAGVLMEVLKEGVEGWSTGAGENIEGVWFDCFGWLVWYGGRTMKVLHYAIGISGLVVYASTVYNSFFSSGIPLSTTLRPLLASLLAPLGSLLGALLASRLIRYHPHGQELLFFTWEPLPTLLYTPMSVLGALVVWKLALTGSTDGRAQLLAQLPVVSALTIWMTSRGLGSSYLPFSHTLPLLLPCFLPRFETWVPVLPWVAGIPPLISAWRFFVPLFGRVGTPGPGTTTLEAARWLTDDIAAALAGVLGWAVLWPVLPGLQRYWKVVAVLGVVPVLLAPMVLEPFDLDHPKRVYVQVAFNVTSGTSALHLAHADRGWTAFDRFTRAILGDDDPRDIWTRIEAQGGSEGDWDVGWPRSPMLASLRVNTTSFSGEWGKTPGAAFRPRVEVLEDTKLGRHRKLRLRMWHGNLISASVAFSGGTIRAWDLEGGRPFPGSAQNGRTVIKHHSGFGSSFYEIAMEVESEREDGKIKVDFWGIDPTCFAGAGREWWAGTMEMVQGRMPRWATGTFLATVGGSWWI